MAVSLVLIAVCDGHGVGRSAHHLDAWTDKQVGNRKRMGEREM